MQNAWIEASPRQRRRRSWFGEVVSLIGWNWFVLRRRASMTVILTLFFAIAALIVIGLFLLGSGLLAYPGSLNILSQYTVKLGAFLFPVLAAILVGSEYSQGMQRQILSRGLSRAQVLIAQLISLFLLLLVLVVIVFLLALLIGFAVPMLKQMQWAVPSSYHWELLPVFLLGCVLNLFLYMTMAVFFATLARTPVGGVAFVLVYEMLELALWGTLQAFLAMGVIQEDAARWIQNIGPWLPGNVANRVAALTSDLLPGNFEQATSLAVTGLPISLLTLLGYCVILIIAAYLLYSRRDILE
uniref:Uncharacterized protein n=1 Tax=Thermosporothrix sp. COM3 TaxID=2490863 RepID=A0A455SM42_9CHLR|nr:hypothetical protein KTC_42540 [Thermosporothrix sp. COM3]